MVPLILSSPVLDLNNAYQVKYHNCVILLPILRSWDWGEYGEFVLFVFKIYIKL